jgi:hypothetical protein
LTRAQQARAASERVIEAQKVDIAEYIGSFAIADKLSPPAGSRLWSKRGPEPVEIEEYPLSGTPPHCGPRTTLRSKRDPGPTEMEEITRHLSSASLDNAYMPDPPSSARVSRSAHTPTPLEPSRRRKIDILLNRLAEIEHDVESLAKSTKVRLESLHYTSGEVPAPFPLKDLYLTYKKLSADLDAVNGKAYSVVELKAQIESQLLPIRDLLKKAKLDWSARWSGAPTRGVFDRGVEHKTGQCFALS